MVEGESAVSESSDVYALMLLCTVVTTWQADVSNLKVSEAFLCTALEQYQLAPVLLDTIVTAVFKRGLK